MFRFRKPLERLSFMRIQALAGCLLASAAASRALGIEISPPDTAPSTQPSAPTETAPPVDPAVRALIAKLGDDDPKVRDDATQKLSDLGKSAAAGLRAAADSDDPEVRSRVKTLICRLERHLPPAAPPGNGMAHSRSVSVSVNQGGRTIDVNDDGRKTHIISHADGQIEMSVTGVDDGKEATETYKAKDAAELKRDNPEAFAIYDQWAGQNARNQARFGGGQFPGVILQRGAFPIQPVPPDMPIQPGDLQLRLEEQRRQIDELQRRMAAEAEQRVHDKMRGEPGKDPAPAGPSETKSEKGENQTGKPDDKPSTRPG